jgi:hypothetical protein
LFACVIIGVCQITESMDQLTKFSLYKLRCFVLFLDIEFLKSKGFNFLQHNVNLDLISALSFLVLLTRTPPFFYCTCVLIVMPGSSRNPWNRCLPGIRWKTKRLFCSSIYQFVIFVLKKHKSMEKNIPKQHESCSSESIQI